MHGIYRVHEYVIFKGEPSKVKVLPFKKERKKPLNSLFIKKNSRTVVQIQAKTLQNKPGTFDLLYYF